MQEFPALEMARLYADLLAQLRHAKAAIAACACPTREHQELRDGYLYEIRLAEEYLGMDLADCAPALAALIAAEEVAQAQPPQERRPS